MRNNLLLSIFILSMIGCTPVETIYQNKSQKCTLKLYEDSSYTFRYPAFAGPNVKESGSYHFEDESIILTYTSSKKKPDVNIGFICTEDNPERVQFTFENLYKETISTTIAINGNPEALQIDDSGNKYISYAVLENKGSLNKGKKIREMSIFYQGLEYIVELSAYNNSRRPNKLEFTLNQFKDQELDTLKRKYLIKDDTILINDISAKALGIFNRELIKLK